MPTSLSNPKTDQVKADYLLAQRCVAGEVTAWDELFSQYQPGLLRTVRFLLSRKGEDADLAEEIAAQVWYALVANNGQLLARYDRSFNARLSTFLRAIARDIMSRHFRSERRRAKRETLAAIERPRHHPDNLDHFGPALDEFLDTLGPSEREFCGQYLLRVGTVDERVLTKPLSRASVWQKTHRIYRRFVKFAASA